MLNSFRKYSSGIAVKILMALLILTFMVWGIGDMLNKTASSTNLATIGKVRISQADFMMHIKNEQENLRRMLGENYSPEIVKQYNIENRVLQRLINSALLKQESESLGLLPGDVDVVRTIRANPAFQNDKGSFDKARFDKMLQAQGISEKTYTDELREKIASGLLMDTIIGTPIVPESMTSSLLGALEEQRVVNVYTLSSSIAGNISPTDSELQAYYKDHSNAFTAPEYRTISYVTLQQSDVKKPAKPTLADIQKAYAERIDDFKKPERRVVDQLLFGNEEAANKAYDALGKGVSFEQVAKTSNILNKDALSLGIVEKANVLEAASEKVFALPKDAVTSPVKSPFGWHIFRVNNILPAATQPLEEVRASIEKDLDAHAEDNGLSTLSNKLDDAIAGGSTLKEAATELGLKITTIAPIDAYGKLANGETSKELPPLDKFIETSFKTDEKSESGLVNSKGGVFYVVRVESITPEHVRAYADVKAKVLEGAKKAQQREKLNGLVGDITNAFEKETTRAGAIDKYNLASTTATVKRIKDDSKLPGELVADIFSRAINDATRAYQTQNGDYVIAVVKTIVPAAPEKLGKSNPALANIKKELSTQIQDEVTTQYLRHLATKYPVSINESALNIKSEE